MGVIATAIRELIAAGLSGDALVAAVERIEEAQAATAGRYASSRQARNRRYYEAHREELKQRAAARLKASESVLKATEAAAPTEPYSSTVELIPPSPPKGGSSPKPEKPKPPVRPRKALSEIGRDWVPDDRTWADCLGILGGDRRRAGHELDKFRDWGVNQPPRKDWDASFRNWCRRAVETPAATGPPRHGGGRPKSSLDLWAAEAARAEAQVLDEWEAEHGNRGHHGRTVEILPPDPREPRPR